LQYITHTHKKKKYRTAKEYCTHKKIQNKKQLWVLTTQEGSFAAPADTVSGISHRSGRPVDRSTSNEHRKSLWVLIPGWIKKELHYTADASYADSSENR